MLKKIVFFIFIMALKPLSGQSLDFGVEVQQNTNLVQKWLLTDDLNEFNRAFSLLDVNQDTMNVYFNTFSMSNNFEIPLYFRYNFKKRTFIDFKLSNTVHTLYMEGVSNYSDYYFVENYGTYADFEAQAQADGFTNVTQSDYENYINAAKGETQNVVRSKEEFKVLSFTTNVGFRLLPHRSIKPYISLGFTAKEKYRKYSYQNLGFTSSNVYDVSKINEGVNKFAQRTFYFNMGFGFEFYRFRAGLYYQAGFDFQATNAKTNSIVVDVNPYTPFQRIHSYGFTICANLFSTPIGKRVTFDEITDNEIVLSNIKRKKYKADFAIRFNRRGYNDVSTYYTTADNRLSVMSRDSILYNNNGTIVSAEKVEMLTFGDVKRIFWSGQLDIVYNRYFGRRLGLEFALGFSSLTTDIETTELIATVQHDTISGPSYVYSSGEPRLRSGVYRNTFNITNFTVSLSYKIIDRDMFALTFFLGSGSTFMVHRSLSFVDLPDGVNGLEIYQTIDQNYYSLDDNSLYAYQGPMDVDFNESPDAVFSKFGNTRLDNSWPTPKPQRFRYPTARWGFEASIERYTLGLCVESSTTYMDGFLLNKYSSIYFSVGYRFIRK